MANIAPRAVLVLALDAAAAVATTSFTVTRPFVALDVTSLCTTTAGGGTLQVSRTAVGGGTLTDLMTVDTTPNLTRCTVLTVAQRTFAAGNAIAVVVGVASAASTTYMQILPSAIPGNA